MRAIRHPWIAVLASCVAFAGSAAAQEFSYAAEPAKKKFDVKIEELRAKYQIDIKVANAEYTLKLNELSKAATANGDLDKVLAYKAESEWIDSGKLPKDTAASLKIVHTMRTAYETKKKAANTAFEKGAKATHTEFLADIDLVIKEETQEGRIESALKVRNLKKEIEKAPLPPSVAPVAVAKEVPPVKPEPTPIPVPKPEPTTIKPDPKATIKPTGSFSWEKAMANPAQIKVEKIDSYTLDPNADKPQFSQIPNVFTKTKAVIYSKPKDKHAGVADITVLSDGYLFVACKYGSEGNSGGGWLATRWTADQFVKNGWHKIDAKDAGGGIMEGKETLSLFVKFVKKDEEMKLRCNKYSPPYAIVFEPDAKK